jgi:phosphocarrier protein HPr
MADIKKIKHYLLEEALFNANLCAEHKYEAFREIVLELFRDSGYGHDTVQTIFNRLLASERRTSFVLEGGVAIPHVVLEEDVIGDMKVGWFLSRKGVVFSSLETEPVHIILCAIGIDDCLRLIVARGAELTLESNFRMQFIRANTNQHLQELVKIALNTGDVHSKIITQDPLTLENTCRAKITVTNKLGLHARAMARLVTLTSKFECKIQIRRYERRCGNKWIVSSRPIIGNGKSIMGLGMLGAAGGTHLELMANGPDAEEAVDAMINMFENKFGEPE